MFLAETTSDVNSYYDKLRLELVARGFRVVPESRLPLTGGNLRSLLQDELKGAELSVHIVGELKGIVPEDDTRPLPEIQYEVASHAGVRQIVWLRRENKATYEWLREGPHADHVEIIQAGFEELRTVTLDALSRPKAAPKSTLAGAAPHIFLLCESQDRGLATEVADWLFDQGVEVTLPIGEGSAEETRADWSENFLIADAVIVLWKSAPEPWFRIVLRQLRKGAAERRSTLPYAVLIPEAASAGQKAFKSHEATVVRDAPVSALGDFVSKIREAARK